MKEDLAADKAFYGEGEEDSEAEEDAGHVHEAVLPAIVFQQVT